MSAGEICGETGVKRQFTPPLARLGVILPSSNRMIEPQFTHYAPKGLAVHFERARITGPHAGSLSALSSEVVRAAQTLADSKVDLIVFNCTATSMKEGPEGDAYLLDLIARNAGVPALSTASAVTQALRALGLQRLALITPYVQKTNDHEKDYFRALGFEVSCDIALGLKGGDEYIKVHPDKWVEMSRRVDRPEIDGFFMSCTNTSQIEAIDDIERELGKPAVSANQAVIWASVKQLAGALAPADATFLLPGRLRAF